MKSIFLIVLNISIFVILYYTIYLQYTQLKNQPASHIFLLLILISIFAFIHETESIACSPFGCSLDENKTIYTKSSLSPICLETKRVNWRRSYLLSFIIFVILNLQTLEVANLQNTKLKNTALAQNLVVFLFAWFVLYWYFNFDNYHRFNLACELEKK